MRFGWFECSNKRGARLLQLEKSLVACLLMSLTGNARVVSECLELAVRFWLRTKIALLGNLQDRAVVFFLLLGDGAFVTGGSGRTIDVAVCRIEEVVVVAACLH